MIQNACVFVGFVFCSTSSPASPPLPFEVVVELRPLRYTLLGSDESSLPPFDVLELMFGLDDSPLPPVEVVVEPRPLRYALGGPDESPLFDVLELMFGLDDSPLPLVEVVVEPRPLRYALRDIDETLLFAVDPKPNPGESPLLVVRSCELLVPPPVRLALDATLISMCWFNPNNRWCSLI
jgi:hypothetical protein